MTLPSFIALLRGCQEDQRPVRIHLKSGTLKGIVVQSDENSVEIKHESGRSVIRMDAIEAVTRE